MRKRKIEEKYTDEKNKKIRTHDQKNKKAWKETKSDSSDQYESDDEENENEVVANLCLMANSGNRKA